MASAKTSALAAQLALLDAPRPATEGPGAQARVRHAAYLASIETIRQQHAAAITSAPGYNSGLGAIYHPADTVAFLADQLEASGVAVVREAYGFRTTAQASAAQVKAA